MKTNNSIIDIFDLRSIEFYLFINDNSIEFIKVFGKKSYSVLHKSEYTDFSIEIISNFFMELKQNKYLFGQPLTIILNISSTFTYIKQIQGSNLTEIQNSIKLLSRKAYDVKFSIIPNGKTKLFVYQAVKKSLLDTLLNCLKKQNITALTISTLPLALLSQAKFTSDKNSMYSYTLFKNKYHLFKIKENILFVSDTQLNRKELEDTILSAFQYNFYTETNSALLLSKLKNKVLNKLSYTPANSQKTTYFHTAHNSLKLLSRIALLLFIFLLFTTGISSLLSSESEIISKYQQKYTEKQLVKDKIDSLETVILEIESGRPKTIQTAPILSAFCQKSYNNLYLTKISINNKLDDSIIVETKGSAKNEDLIFRYQKECLQYTQPYKISLNLIKPQIINNRGLADTNITFTFSTAIEK